MLPSDAVKEIERRIGYTFSDKSLLTACFTHSSYANEHGTESNERLEFLGDALLGFFAAEKLYGEGGDEGQMTFRRQELVSERPLRECVERAGLDGFLLHAGREVPGGKAVSSLFEALIAGIYLDGGIEKARAFAEKMLGPVSQDAGDVRNYKGELQEFLQARGLEKAVYRVALREGAPHMPTFTVEASAAGQSALGRGGSKAAAEKQAAKALLIRLQQAGEF